jgi:2-polyprenyl-6-hydroxyphenyl methylase/3-demethylubiquinone-9 3-methyltransferase
MSSEARFRFGENWLDFSELINDTKIRESEARLASLVGVEPLKGKTFLDIGSGSGLHSLAALRLGVERVLAVDLDPQSVATTKGVLAKFWNGTNWAVEERSVFDLDPQRAGTYDVVYSWGVLHHTGDMQRAIRKACEMVKPGGLLALALYGKTPYCGMWTRIKRWYVGASPRQRELAEKAYVRLFGAYLLLRGKRLSTHIANYEKKRGMNFIHDVRDWIGGYPYESISPQGLRAIVEPLGFRPLRSNVRRRSGLFGSGNDEYVFVKETATAVIASEAKQSSVLK